MLMRTRSLCSQFAGSVTETGLGGIIYLQWMLLKRVMGLDQTLNLHNPIQMQLK